jgi:hypothetical protein
MLTSLLLVGLEAVPVVAVVASLRWCTTAAVGTRTEGSALLLFLLLWVLPALRLCAFMRMMSTNSSLFVLYVALLYTYMELRIRHRSMAKVPPALELSFSFCECTQYAVD